MGRAPRSAIGPRKDKLIGDLARGALAEKLLPLNSQDDMTRSARLAFADRDYTGVGIEIADM